MFVDDIVKCKKTSGKIRWESGCFENLQIVTVSIWNMSFHIVDGRNLGLSGWYIYIFFFYAQIPARTWVTFSILRGADLLSMMLSLDKSQACFPDLQFVTKNISMVRLPSWNKWRVNWDHVSIKMKHNMWTKPANTTKYIKISCNIRRLSQTNIQTTCQGPWNKVHSWNRISSEVHCLRNYIMTTQGFRVGNQRHLLRQWL